MGDILSRLLNKAENVNIFQVFGLGLNGMEFANDTLVFVKLKFFHPQHSRNSKNVLRLFKDYK